jgi:hypothetical protein
MMKLIILDILYPENWLPDAIEETLKVNIEEEIEDDEAVNMQFYDFGLESKQFIKNSGSSIIFLVVYIMLWAIYILLIAISPFSTNI